MFLKEEIQMAIYKVTGIGERKKFFDESSYKDAIHYIMDPKKALYFGEANVSSITSAADEMLRVAINFGKNSGKRLRHSILSFNDSDVVTPEMADAFARQIITHYSPYFQIVYAVHTNTRHVHIHFVMNQISFVDGHRYYGKKQDYYSFQRHMKSVTHLPVIMSKDAEIEL